MKGGIKKADISYWKQ